MSTNDLIDPIPDDVEHADPAELAASLELLAEENRRLRDQYARAKRATYHRTALALAGVGIIAVASGLVFPDARSVLFAIGATGLFAGIITYYLTPERLVAVTTGDAVYAAHHATGTALVRELGLEPDRLYVPLDPTTGDAPARLYIPQSPTYDLPNDDQLDDLFVVTSDDTRRGVSIPPTGAALYREFGQIHAGALATDPAVLADQLTDGLVEGFELATRATPEADPDTGRVTVGVIDSALGAVDRFDHPIASFLGVGLAVGLNHPITIDVTTDTDDRFDARITATWPATEQSPTD